MKHYDGIFIGGGPGGYESALYARRFDKKVAIIEKYRLGGICLHSGCIPAKTLVGSSRQYLAIQNQERYGLTNIKKPDIDWSRVNARRIKVINDNTWGLEKLMESKGIDVIYGVGSLVDKNTVQVTPDDKKPFNLKAEKIFIATGSYPVPVPGTKWEEDWMIPGEDCLEWSKLPESILILGAGVMGCEFAGIFAPFGVETHLAEILDNVLPNEDIYVSRTIGRELKKLGVNLYLGCKMESYEKRGDKVAVRIEGKGEILVDKVLICAGRKAIVDGLNLENVGVELDKYGSIQVDDHLKTTVDNIYAFGDVTGPPLLAHSAFHEGKFGVIHAFTGVGERDLSAIPSAIFTTPEVGRVGLTEQQCKAGNIKCRIGLGQMRAVGRSHAEGDLSGFMKLILDYKDRIIGGHMVGKQAGDIIHVLALAMSLRMSSRELEEKLIFSHPTFSEVIWETLKELNFD